MKTTMPATVARGAFILGAVVLLAACERPTPAPRADTPMTLTPGTVGYQLREQQLQNAQSGANPGWQNPVATERSVRGIERAGPGTGTTGAGAPVAVNPGTTGVVRGPGVGAPTR